MLHRFFFYKSVDDWKILLPFVGGAISLIYIIEKQQLDEALLFKQLFYDFNKRYDDLNEELKKIKDDSNIELTETEKFLLSDYFNLCGEEYLFYKNGYIYPEVWESWVNGMRIFLKIEKIKVEWMNEFKTNSYYGLDIEKEVM